MNPQTAWYVARATGYVAWGLVTASVVAGLLLAGRSMRRRPGRAWTLDLHRFLAGAAVVFTGLHIAGLVADNYVHFGIAEVLVPFASRWRSSAVALGVVSVYLLAAIELTSLFMRHIPRRIWRGVHLTSYLLFWLTTFHLLTAGSDRTNPASRVAAALAMAAVVSLTIVRIARRAVPRRALSLPGRTPVLR